jgi:hypothetical protein
MNDNPKPISAFDEICELTIKTMHRLDMETLLQLQKQAVHELDRAKLTKGCIDTALSLKRSELEGAKQATSEADENQPSLLD